MANDFCKIGRAFSAPHIVHVAEGVQESRAQVTSRFISGSSIALPAKHLIGPGGEVLVRDGWVSENTVVANLP